VPGHAEGSKRGQKTAKRARFRAFWEYGPPKKPLYVGDECNLTTTHSGYKKFFKKSYSNVIPQQIEVKIVVRKRVLRVVTMNEKTDANKLKGMERLLAAECDQAVKGIKTAFC
jgi:hypothetical protein